jgi:hypothetical protein
MNTPVVTPSLQTPQLDAAASAPPVVVPVAPVAPAAPPASGFAQRFGQAQKQILSDPQTADVALNQPSGWARSVLLSVTHALAPSSRAGQTIQQALSGLQDASSGTPEGGWLTAVTGTLRNRADRLAAQKQQDFNNDLKTQESQRQNAMLSLEQQRTTANLAESHINQLKATQMMRDEDLETQQKSTVFGQAQVDRNTAQGMDTIGTYTPAELTAGIKDGTIKPGEVVSNVTGWVDKVGSDGKPVIDPVTGEPQREAVTTLQKAGPKATPYKIADQSESDYIKKWTGRDMPVGTEYTAADHANMVSQAHLAESADLKIRQDREELKRTDAGLALLKSQKNEADMNVEEKQQKIEGEKIIGENWQGDLVRTYDAIAADPKLKDKMGAVNFAAGPGVIEQTRRDTLNDLQKKIDDNTKALKNATADNDVDAANQAKANLTAAEAQQNIYLHLHPNDSPQMTQIQQDLLDIDRDPNKQAAYILNQPTVNDKEKAYLLQRNQITNTPVAAQWLAKPETAANIKALNPGTAQIGPAKAGTVNMKMPDGAFKNIPQNQVPKAKEGTFNFRDSSGTLWLNIPKANLATARQRDPQLQIIQ